MRQLAAASRGAYPTPEPLQVPAFEAPQDALPSEPNVYTDGSVKVPCDADIAHAGAGIWVPRAPPQLADPSHACFDFAHFAWRGDALELWAPIVGLA
eukprot:12333386-Alexandrium_andersonii.AAC.1